MVLRRKRVVASGTGTGTGVTPPVSGGAVASEPRPAAVSSVRIPEKPAAGAEPQKAVQPITERDSEEFRTMLLAERDRLRRELAAMDRQLRQVEELGLVEQSSEDDYGDVAAEAVEREKGFALETSVQGMLHMVEDALRKLDAGQYGICERCGQPIDVERLRALPFARLCIRCKTEEERERHQARWT
ncbi:MAG: TraR/DksA C4-type zinc finger protein [Armatimonadota bacterium]|nr:TraR/DksA C4-type zinc finger protein [Armatimonadota bacterium]MDR7602212.1 TraR/DksA C4-type zinc finger protein [Armatimonadota bacterium]